MSNSPALPRQHRDTVIERRKKYQRDAKPDPTFAIEVRFAMDFNTFAARTARELARKVKFRSDGGKVARGLVADSDPEFSFYAIHNELLRDKDTKEGRRIWLVVKLWRRNAKAPADRWVIAIQFWRHLSSKEFPEEEMPAEKPPKVRASRIIDQAQEVAKSIPGDQGKRIRAWLKLAEKVGYPAMLNLWHYEPTALHEFAWASAEEQKKMIKKGGGFPLDGELDGVWQSGPPSWRVHPFRGLLQRYFDSTPEAWKLKNMDDLLGESIQELISAPGGKGAGGESAISKPMRQFRKHLKTLAKTPGNLYYESDRNTKDRRSIWERLD